MVRETGTTGCYRERTGRNRESSGELGRDQGEMGRARLSLGRVATLAKVTAVLGHNPPVTYDPILT